MMMKTSPLKWLCIGVVAIFFTCSAFNMALAQKHWVYVAAESDDEVALVSFDAKTGHGVVEDVVKVGEYPTENEGPHGINISPDGRHWYLSVAHGNPYGWLYKFTTADNKFLGRTQLGLFPASMEISTATGLLYVVNFNLHGDMEPSIVSVVDPQAMEVVNEITTGIMPHGSRISSDGRWQYHVSMMTDELIEVNTLKMEVSRRLNVAPGDKTGTVQQASHTTHKKPVAKPTWADPHPNKPFVYVANNGSDEAVEVNTDSWKITRRFQTGKAPYNLEVSHDGKLLVVTYKGEGATGIWDLQTGKELAKIKNSRLVTHGVSISPDNTYAFISVEGKNGEPGSVDVIDLHKLELAEVIEVGKQAGGIIHWKMSN
ncbi:YncE family protein [Aliifodinibius sp. S!AR15-10]|uniref:YncE family protein n=1 Tax=Aliifodinibius sp. S!AR15-10 TaxID=2950437 RepID=UPI0028667195|nr:YncE family protein [Aliifodinibius sp. S!AR15-10]MDR8389652.1 YncE family protein [Aliifodinibius sp. S!AR15-10]